MRKSDKKQPLKARGSFKGNQVQRDWYEFAFRTLLFVERTVPGPLRYLAVCDRLACDGIQVSAPTLKRIARRERMRIDWLRRSYRDRSPITLLDDFRDPSVPNNGPAGQAARCREAAVSQDEVDAMKAWLAANGKTRK